MDGMTGLNEDANQKDYLFLTTGKKTEKKLSQNNFNTISGGTEQMGSTFKSVEHSELRKET